MIMKLIPRPLCIIRKKLDFSSNMCKLLATVKYLVDWVEWVDNWITVCICGCSWLWLKSWNKRKTVEHWMMRGKWNKLFLDLLLASPRPVSRTPRGCRYPKLKTIECKLWLIYWDLVTVWPSVNCVGCINDVTVRWARLVIGWVTIFGLVYHLGI